MPLITALAADLRFDCVKPGNPPQRFFGNRRRSGLGNLIKPPPPVGLVAAYSFDEGTGATVGDSSGAGNQGTITSATWTVNGKYGRALTFDGTSSYVTVPDAWSTESHMNPSAGGGWSREQ